MSYCSNCAKLGREISGLDNERKALREALGEATRALEAVGGTPGAQVPNCRGGCHRWSLDCDYIHQHPEVNQAHGPAHCHGAIARAALEAIRKLAPDV